MSLIKNLVNNSASGEDVTKRNQGNTEKQGKACLQMFCSGKEELADEDIEQKIEGLMDSCIDEIEEFLTEHEDSYSGDIYEFAFREAVRQGNIEFIEAYAEEIELNDCDGESSYLDETDDETVLSVLMDLGAYRSWQYYDDCRFAVETVNFSVIAFATEFQQEVFDAYLSRYGLSEDDVVAMLKNSDEGAIAEFNGNQERDFLEDLDAIGASVEGESIELTSKEDDDGYELYKLIEELGWNCDFEGSRWHLETTGVYFIK